MTKNAMSTEPNYSVTRDPLFLITVAFFVPLTTVIPAIMGQPQLMPLMQSLALTLFLAIALRNRDMRQALFVVTIWVVLQLMSMALLGALAPTQVEQAVPDGFALRTGLVEWIYTSAPAPGLLQASPMVRLLEIIAVIGGALLTGGLIGAWVLVRTVNQVGFSVGILLTGLEDISVLVATIPWTLLRISGYAGLVALFAEPLWSRNWSPKFYIEQRKKLALVAVALLLASIILEAFLPGIWPSLFR